MKNKKLQELTQLFHAEIEELTRLEFGCKVQIKRVCDDCCIKNNTSKINVFDFCNNQFDYSIQEIILDTHEEIDIEGYNKVHRDDLAFHLDNMLLYGNFGFKIIGKDITLEDVLKVFVRTREVGKQYYLFRVSGGSLCYSFQIFNEDDDRFLETFDWELSKPLHLQSPEVIDFLHAVLITK